MAFWGKIRQQYWAIDPPSIQSIPCDSIEALVMSHKDLSFFTSAISLSAQIHFHPVTSVHNFSIQVPNNTSCKIIDFELNQPDIFPQTAILDKVTVNQSVASISDKLSIERIRVHSLSIRIFGINYQQRMRWRELKNEQKKRRSKAIGKEHIPKAYTGSTTKLTDQTESEPKSAFFWDLLYAILQPPLGIDSDSEISNLPHDLYPFQKIGVQFLTSNGGALLADEMGTGKTVQAIVALRVLIHQAKVQRAVIVSPVSILRQWSSHLKEWAPELLVTVISGTKEQRQIDWRMPAHVYLIAYDTLKNDIENKNIQDMDFFDAIILDEAQYVKSKTSKRTKQIFKLSAKYKWALTGTPLENSIEDIINIFRFLRPNESSRLDSFSFHLKQRIEPFFLRRRKIDVLKELPPKIKQEIWLTLDDDQQEEYDRVLIYGVTTLNNLDREITQTDILAVINKLKQICNFHPEKYSSPKAISLCDQIEEIIQSNQKVIIFSQYITEGVDKIERLFSSKYKVAKIIGGQRDRGLQVEKFQNSPDTPILVASIKAGGVGLNLQAASYVIHFDHWWNPAIMWQAESRAHRQGQKLPVNIYSYWISNTVEEKIYNKLKEKGLLFEEYVDQLSETDIDKLISTEEWLDVLGVKSKTKKAQKVLNTIEEIVLELAHMSNKEFSELIVKLFREDFSQAQITSVDSRGFDGIAQQRIANITEYVLIRFRTSTKPVSLQLVNSFISQFYNDTNISKGYLISKNGFSEEAQALITKSDLITPLDINQIASLIKQHNLL